MDFDDSPEDAAFRHEFREWLRANVSFKRYVLRELERNGPMRSRQFEDRSRVPWPSSGWTGSRNVGQMLEFLGARGEIATVGREGTQRLWDLADRWRVVKNGIRNLGQQVLEVIILAPAGVDEKVIDQRFREMLPGMAVVSDDDKRTDNRTTRPKSSSLWSVVPWSF